MASVMVCDICGQTVDRADLIVVRIEDSRALRRIANDLRLTNWRIKAAVRPSTLKGYDGHYELHAECFEAQIASVLPGREPPEPG